MKYESISDIYSANEIYREKLRTTVAGISDEEATMRPEGEKWSIAQIVEHVSIVESGIAMICSRLLEGARKAGKPAGGIAVSDKFLEGTKSIANEKLEAPDRVHPTGNVPITDSLAKMEATSQQVDALRGDLEKFDLAEATFPHPYLGQMTAAEWLVMYGGHAARHAAQIERLLAKIRQ